MFRAALLGIPKHTTTMWSIKSLFTSSLLLSSVIAEDVLISRRNWVQRKRDETFDLTYFHINDVHAHLDEFRASQGTVCVWTNMHRTSSTNQDNRIASLHRDVSVVTLVSRRS